MWSSLGGRAGLTLAACLAGAMVAATPGPTVAAGTPSDLGSLDPSFGDHGVVTYLSACTGCGPAALAVQPDGMLLVAVHHGRSSPIRRLRADGSLDPNFGQGGVVEDVPVEAFSVTGLRIVEGDSILVSGSGPNVNGEPSTSPAILTRLLPDGALDPSFGTDGSVSVRPLQGNTGFLGSVGLPDGGMLAFGYAEDPSDPGRGRYALVVRLTADGELVTDWGDGGITTFTEERDEYTGTFLSAVAKRVVPQPDGGTLVFGEDRVWRLDAAGAFDPSFGEGGSRRLDVDASAGLPDGGFVVVGRDFVPDIGYEAWLGRYLPDATPDPTFGDAGSISFGEPHAADYADAVALGPDGAILVGGGTTGHGSGSDFLVARVSSAGALDLSVGINGVLSTDISGEFDALTDITPMPDGRVAALGYTYDSATLHRSVAVAVYGPHDLDRSSPVATITRPASDTAYGRLGIRTIRGTSHDRLSGVTGTEVALRLRRPDGSCGWMGERGWVDRLCSRPLWHDAGIRWRWAWPLPRLLPRSIDARGRWYTAYARAADAGGNVERRFEQGRNRVRFEIGLG